MKTLNWQNQNKDLLEKMNRFRESFTCKVNCGEWKKWKYCSHLRNATAKKFDKEMEIQIINLAKLRTNLTPVESSQSLAIS